MKSSYFIAGAAILAAGAYWLTQGGETSESVAADTPELSDGALVAVKLPTSLSDNAALGKRAFEAKCAACHNVNGAGRKGVAPPLVHVIYEPSHHGDESFQRAVANGVRGHHWPFGNMPPVEGLTRADVQMIVTYIRELQRENGIH